MSLAAILWAIVAMMQLCMTSQSGMKKLGYPFLSFHYSQPLLKIYSVIFLALSLYLNYLDNGFSVGIMTWIFLVITLAFFIHILFFHKFREYFFILWMSSVLLALSYSLYKFI